MAVSDASPQRVTPLKADQCDGVLDLRHGVLEDLLELRDGDVLRNAHEVGEGQDAEDLELAQDVAVRRGRSGHQDAHVPGFDCRFDADFFMAASPAELGAASDVALTPSKLATTLLVVLG